VLRVVFALALLIATPLAVRATGWRTPSDAEMRIADYGWPLLGWVRFMAAIHVARFFAGGLLRGTPLWSWHLRLCGAKMDDVFTSTACRSATTICSSSVTMW
jgi:hypothetical protein